MFIDTLISTLLLLIGLPMSLVGYKIINPFRFDKNPEKEFEFYKTCGLMLRLSGPILLVIALVFMLNLNQ